jgi:response regulator RpfG family c-di-GMP phosphodiesterase
MQNMNNSDSPQALRTASMLVEGGPDIFSGIRVLIVDDDRSITKLLSIVLGEVQCYCATAANVPEALEALEREPFDAVISDLHMPGGSGLTLLAETRGNFPHLAFLVTTGVDDLDVAVHAMRAGADDYLVKPLREETVMISLERAIRKRQLEQQVENYRRNLEKLVGERTQQLDNAFRYIQRSYGETLQALGTAIDLRDGETAGHSRRVCRYSLEIASSLSLSADELCNLARAAYLHDIGKLGVPDSVLLKPGSLTDDEWIVMRRHVQIGFDLLKAIPFLANAAEIVLAHHERFDGCGYPRGLCGAQIPLGARIFSVADALDAITSHRPYRAASTFEVAREEIISSSASQFDPEIVDVFLRIPSERWREIREDPRHLPPPIVPELSRFIAS